MTMIEHRTAEIRAGKGRELTGLAVPWESPIHIGAGREMFARGAARSTGTALLNLAHDVSRPLAREPGSLAFSETDAGLAMRATLPNTHDGADVHELVADGVLTGLSIEFHSRRDRYDGDLRIIEDAEITGCAVVAEPAYRQTHVEARGVALASALAACATGRDLDEAAAAAGVTPEQLRRVLTAIGALVPEPAPSQGRRAATLPAWAL